MDTQHTHYFSTEYFAARKNMVDEFSATARQLAERFSRECKEKRLLPSYESFSKWMESSNEMIA